jgi:hypothetical protein
MTDETEVPVLANLTEVLAPTHEPAPVPPAPSGEVVPLRVVSKDVEYPVESNVPAHEEDGVEHDEDGEVEQYVTALDPDLAAELLVDVANGVLDLRAYVDDIVASLRTHGAALNEILHALHAKPKRKAKAKPKAKAKAKAKAKTKRARR